MEDNKKIYCSKNQKEMLIELLKKDPQFISGKFTKDFTFKQARNRWLAIAETLNAIPGCVKDWSQWKRTWQDSRTKVRGKKAMVNRHLNSTGGGPQTSETFTPIEKQILDLVNPITIDGDANIPMPDTIFHYDEIKDLTIELENVNPDDTIFTIQPDEMKVDETNYTVREANAPVGLKHNERKVGKLTAAKRLTNSLAVGKDICEIGHQKCKLKEAYYDKKLQLLERQTVAIEKMSAAILNKWLV